MALPIAQKLIPLIYERQWVVLVFERPCLLSGDEPVAIVGKQLEPGEAWGGMAHGDEIVFRCGPDTRFGAHALGGTDEGRPGTPRMASIINRHVAFGCHCYIVQTPGVDALARLTVPEKATPTQAFGNFVLFNPRLSVDGADDVKRRVLAMEAHRHTKKQPGGH